MMRRVNDSTMVAPEDIQRLHARAIQELPLLAACLSLESMCVAVGRSAAHHFETNVTGARAVAAYVASLQAGDLGLAIACAAGSGEAWDHVVLTYRPMLYRAAAILSGDDRAGRDLADGLWAELYGVGRTKASLAPEAERKSLIGSFHGRARLSTWLRSVLAQRHIDLVRSEMRHRPLDTEEGADAASHDGLDGFSEVADPDRGHLADLFQQTLAAELGQLAATDRLRVAFYYSHGLRLAEIGRILGEHEATVSRRLARIRRRLKTGVERAMQLKHGLTDVDIDLCYQDVLNGRAREVDVLGATAAAVGRSSTVALGGEETERQ